MLSTLGVLLAFVLIVTLRVRNIDFSISILIGSLIIALTSEAPIDVIVKATRQTILDPNTINLTFAVALITVLGYSLKETSLMTEMIEGLRSILPTRILLAIIPAMFGLLTLPGGALMSAPFNEPEAKRLGLKPEHKTYINVWFRHLWYWASPLSPVAILASNLANFNLNSFLAAQLPILVITLAIGFLMSSNFIHNVGYSSHGANGLPEVIKGITPIVLSVVISAFGFPSWLALAIGVAVLYIIRKVPLERALKMIQSVVRWDLAVAVVSMLFFRFVVESSGSVQTVFQSFEELGVPLIVILIIIPLLVGSISGTPTMGIGIIFPLLIPLLGNYNVYVVSIIYVGLICGYIASPMHLCLVLTNNYYRSELRKVYKHLVPSVVVLYVLAMTYYLFMNGGVPF
jgi:integral membrane protein (TIGR00529 family)